MVKTRWLQLLLVLTLLIGLLPAAVAFAEDGINPEVQGLVEEGIAPDEGEEDPDSWGGGNFKFYGTVESLPPAGWYGTWTVSGRFVNVDMYTRIKGMPAVGSTVEVKGWLQPDGSVNATKIEVKYGGGGGGGYGKFKFYGTVESLPPAGWYGTWTVSGRFVNVDMNTRIKGMPAVGSTVEVQGWLQPDGSVNATKIEVKYGGGGGGYGGAYVKFYGIVQVLPNGGWYGDWVVNNTTVHVTSTTLIKPKRGTVRIGAYVEVKGFTQPDGSVNAIQIEVKG